jgi:hypothetical protein
MSDPKNTEEAAKDSLPSRNPEVNEAPGDKPASKFRNEGQAKTATGGSLSGKRN